MVIRWGHALRTQRHLQHQPSDLMYTKYIDFMRSLKHRSKTQDNAMGHITFARRSIPMPRPKETHIRYINISVQLSGVKIKRNLNGEIYVITFCLRIVSFCDSLEISSQQVIFEWYDPFRSQEGTRVGWPFICICWLLRAMEFVLLVVYDNIV